MQKQHNGYLKITLVKSLIGRLPVHIRTAHALGLKKINATKVVKNSPSIQGMIQQLNYLLKVEETSQS